MYSYIDWQDEQWELPERYTITDVSSGNKTTADIAGAHGEEINEGTPQSAYNFGHMDTGIHDVHLAFLTFLQERLRIDRETKEHFDEHDAEFSAETGEVTLTNTSNFPFNNSTATVALTTVRNTLNYDLEVVVESFSGGLPGTITVTDKQLNGFKIAFEGSAKSVTVKYKVRGGMYA